MTAAVPARAVDPRSGASVPGWGLRGLLGVAVLTGSVTTLLGAAAPGVTTLLGLLTVGLGLGVVLAPGSGVPTLWILCVLGVRLLAPAPSAGWQLALLVAALPAVHQLSGICAAVPAGAEVELRGLRPALARYLAAVLVVELGVLLLG